MLLEMLEEEFDDKQAQTHASGIQDGLVRAVLHLRKIAGSKFQDGADREANALRTIAHELEQQAEKVYIAPDPYEGTPWQGEGKSDA